MSGSLTISISGTPVRLRSMAVFSAASGKPSCRLLPASSYATRESVCGFAGAEGEGSTCAGDLHSWRLLAGEIRSGIFGAFVRGVDGEGSGDGECGIPASRKCGRRMAGDVCRHSGGISVLDAECGAVWV